MAVLLQGQVSRAGRVVCALTFSVFLLLLPIPSVAGTPEASLDQYDLFFPSKKRTPNDPTDVVYVKETVKPEQQFDVRFEQIPLHNALAVLVEHTHYRFGVLKGIHGVVTLSQPAMPWHAILQEIVAQDRLIVRSEGDLILLDPDPNAGLSTGQIIGIGLLVFSAVLLGVVVYFIIGMKQRPKGPINRSHVQWK